MTDIDDRNKEILEKKQLLEKKLIDFFIKLIDNHSPKKVPSSYLGDLELILKYLKS